VEVFLHGGGTLIFDEYGRLKFHVHNSLLAKDAKRISPRQIERMHYLAERGYYLTRASRTTVARASRQRMFGQMHMNRALNRSIYPTEGWVDDDEPEPEGGDGHNHGATVGEVRDGQDD
jgi:hypothetical protein